MPRSPESTYLYLGQLLGKLHNSSLVGEIKPHLFYADSIVPNGERGTVALRYDENSTFAVEDLVGMVLNFARETAQNYVHTPVTDVVITVRHLCFNSKNHGQFLTFLSAGPPTLGSRRARSTARGCRARWLQSAFPH